VPGSHLLGFNRHLTPSISDMSSSQNELPTSDRNTGTQIGGGAASATNLQDGIRAAVLPATAGAGEAVLTLADPPQKATKSVETPKKKRIHTARKVGTFNSKNALLVKYKNENESLSKLKNFKDMQESLRSSPRLQGTNKTFVPVVRGNITGTGATPERGSKVKGMSPLSSSTPQAEASANAENKGEGWTEKSPTSSNLSIQGEGYPPLPLASKKTKGFTNAEYLEMLKKSKAKLQDKTVAGESEPESNSGSASSVDSDFLADFENSMNESSCGDFNGFTQEELGAAQKNRAALNKSFGSDTIESTKAKLHEVNDTNENDYVGEWKSATKKGRKGEGVRDDSSGQNPPAKPGSSNLNMQKSNSANIQERRKNLTRKNKDDGDAQVQNSKKVKLDNSSSFANALKKGLKIEIRSTRANADLDQVDFNHLELFMTNTYIATKEKPSFHIVRDIVEKGRSMGGVWYVLKNEEYMNWILKCIPEAGIPDGRTDYGYKVFGPGCRPYRYFLIKGIKECLWRQRDEFVALIRALNPHLDYMVEDFQDGSARPTHIRVCNGLLNKKREVNGKGHFSITLELDEFLIKDLIKEGNLVSVAMFSQVKAVGGGIEKAMRLMGVKTMEGATSLEDLLADTKLQDDMEDLVDKEELQQAKDKLAENMEEDTNQEQADTQASAMDNGE
jgi:hypothetical protein